MKAFSLLALLLVASTASADFVADLNALPDLLSPESQCDLAKDELPAAEAFCTDPIEFVCARGGADARAPLDRGVELYKEWADPSFNKLVSFAKNDEAGMTYFVRASYSGAIKKTANIAMTWEDLESAMKESVADLKAALDRKDIPKAAREKIKKQLDGVHMMKPETIGKMYAKYRYAQDQGTNPPDVFYRELCGMEGTVENAMYDSETGELMLCPAWVAAHAKLANSKEELMSILRGTMLHEIGHAIDYDSLKPHSKTLYADVVKDIPTTLAGLIGNRPHNEVVADYLAIEGQLERFRGRGLTPNYMANLLRNRYRVYCDDTSTDWSFFSEGHAPGGWRIEHIASHPDIQDVLKCKNTKQSKQLKPLPNKPASK